MSEIAIASYCPVESNRLISGMTGWAKAKKKQGRGYFQPSAPPLMEGLILDPTYKGKAFAALLDLVRTGEIKEKSKVLFWHTGGLMNIMAYNHFTGFGDKSDKQSISIV